LSNLFKNQIQIQIFEKSDQIGGRIDSFEYFNRFYETGGTILHPKNLYMNEFLKISSNDLTYSIRNKYKILFNYFNSRLRKR
jgi:protoporphyrinogen oxidase